MNVDRGVTWRVPRHFLWLAGGMAANNVMLASGRNRSLAGGDTCQAAPVVRCATWLRAIRIAPL